MASSADLEAVLGLPPDQFAEVVVEEPYMPPHVSPERLRVLVAALPSPVTFLLGAFSRAQTLLDDVGEFPTTEEAIVRGQVAQDALDAVATLIALLLYRPDSFFASQHPSHVLWLDNLVGELLEAFGCGVRHPFHDHPLLRTNSAVVYHAYQGAWSCDNCGERQLRPRNEMFHCILCNYDLCAECLRAEGGPRPAAAAGQLRLAGLLRRVGEIADEHPSLLASGYSTPPASPRRGSLANEPPPRSPAIEVAQPEMPEPRDMDYVAFPVVPADTAQLVAQLMLALRRRTICLSLGAGLPGPVSLANDVLSVPAFARHAVDARAFLPVVMTGKRLERQATLGPFLRGTSMPDDAPVGHRYFPNPGALSDDDVAAAFAELRGVMTAMQAEQVRLLRHLLEHEAAEVREAALAWVACVTHANAVRRQLGGPAISASGDGFLVNLTSALLAVMQDAPEGSPCRLDDVDLGYFATARVTRVARWEPLVPDPGPWGADETPLSPPAYYPAWHRHHGVSCDVCHARDFAGTRFKCAMCADFDLCEDCHASGPGAHGHDAGHCFLRLRGCVPYFWSKLFAPLHHEAPEDADAADEAPALPDCSGCGAQARFACASCAVACCEACLPAHEAELYRPGTGHHPGHSFLDLREPVPRFLLARVGRMVPLFAHALLPEATFAPATELFALTARLLHEGALHTILRYEQLLTQLQREEAAPSNPLTPAERSIRLQSLAKAKYAVLAQLAEPGFLRAVLRFYIMAAERLLRELQGGGASALYKRAPQHLVEDIAFFTAALPMLQAGELLETHAAELEGVVKLLARVISHKELASQHVRVFVVRALAQLFPYEHVSAPSVPRTTTALAPVFRDSPELQQGGRLVGGLVAMFADMEHATLDDRLNVRRTIAQMLREMRAWPGHAAAFEAVDEGAEEFVMLVNCLFNDISYLLDETALSVTAWQEALDQLSAANGSSAQEMMQQAHARQLVNYHSSKSKQLAGFLLETLRMVAWSCGVPALVSTLFAPRLLARTASTLNYALCKLTSDQWRDAELGPATEALEQLVAAYLALEARAAEAGVDFLGALGADGRAVGDAELEAVAALLPESFHAPFRALIASAEAAAQQCRLDEEQLGEVPDEFLDPLLQTLMTDPVILPSGQTIDRPVIERHLLTDQTNPFNREPLTSDMLKPDEELRARIEAFVAGRRSAPASASVGDGEGAGEEEGDGEGGDGEEEKQE